MDFPKSYLNWNDLEYGDSVKNEKINLGKNLLLASIFTAEETEECPTMVKNDAKKIRKHEGEEKPCYEKRETSWTMSLKYNKAKL